MRSIRRPVAVATTPPEPTATEKRPATSSGIVVFPVGLQGSFGDLKPPPTRPAANASVNPLTTS